MTKQEQLRLVLQELSNRKLLTKPTFLDPTFEIQYRCAQSWVKQKAIQCTRRAGKSKGEGKSLLHDAVNTFPGGKHLYFGLTLGSAKNIIWDILLEELDREKVQHSPNPNNGEIKLKNNSFIKLYGLDASYKQLAKVLGSAYRTVKIDEAGSVTQNLRKFCYQMVRPALIDVDGTLTLLGTPENIMGTFFQEVMEAKEQGWQTWKWTTFDNPYMRDKWTQEIEWIKANNPNFMQTSEFRTHYLNEWCADDGLLIYKIMDHTIVSAPNVSGWTFILGIDLGHSDSNAFVVSGYHPSSPTGYILYSYKESGMDFTDTANMIKKIGSNYPISKMVIDGANKQGVEEMRRRHDLPLVAAEKSDKTIHMKLLRDDIIQGRIKITSDCDDLLTEMKSLQWSDKTQLEEDERCENHLCDALLYNWKEMRNYLFKPEPPKLDRNSNEFMKQYEKDLAKRIKKARNDY